MIRITAKLCKHISPKHGLEEISTNLANISLHPLQQLPLVLQAIVQTKVLVCNNLFAGHEAIRPDSIIEVHHHYLIIGGIDQQATIVVGIAVQVEAAALDEDVYRQGARSCSICRREDIGEKTILGPPVPELVLEIGP